MDTLLIAIRAIAATGVVLLAPVQVLRRPKDQRHKAIGRSWVVLMYFVCVSGMFIYSITGGFTFFHALAIFTFFTTTLGVIMIRRGHVRTHAFNMIGSWLGAVTAGLFAVIIPTREIPRLVVAEPLVFWTILMGVIVAATLWVAYVLRFVPVRRPAEAVASPVA